MNFNRSNEMNLVAIVSHDSGGSDATLYSERRSVWRGRQYGFEHDRKLYDKRFPKQEAPVDVAQVVGLICGLGTTPSARKLAEAACAEYLDQQGYPYREISASVVDTYYGTRYLDIYVR